ncbi:MAG: hypothetical protein KDD63_14830, partial [Bacteroidetes bacterium]|nr:hypothetical protein [Bacteroidota bacterium]
GKSLFDFIVNEFDICSLPDAEPFVTNLLKIGKAQILLDALDEVQVEHEDRVIQEIKDLSDKYDKCQYIMTCRIAAFNAHFEQFTDVEIDDFNDGQIQEFIHNWFQVEPELAKECWEKLESMQTVKELASTPILLTLLCILYEDSLDFPQSRAEIYMEAIDTMLKKWDSSRRIKRKGESTYETLSFTKRKTLLARIAFQTFSQGEFFIPQRRLEKLIKDYIQNLPHIKESSLEVESREVLTSMIAQHGLIVPRAKGIYSFSHLSIQELFTAHFLVSSPQSEQLIKDAIENYVSNPQWREVFLLIAGMLEEADGFIMNLREYIDIYAHEYGLIDFLSEANNLLKNSSIIKGKSRERIIAGLQNVMTESINRSYELLRINARTLSLDINYNRSHYLNLTLSFIIALEENQFDALDQKIDLVVRRALTLVDNYILEQDHAFKNDISFILEIPTYLQLNLLLLDCLLNSGAYISNQTRQNVLDELLLPPPTNIPIT